LIYSHKWLKGHKEAATFNNAIDFTEYFPKKRLNKMALAG